MRGPSLQKTTIISFALHMTAFLIAFLFLKQSNKITIPPSYTVNLVSPEIIRKIDRVRDIQGTTQFTNESSPVKVISKKHIKKAPKKTKENRTKQEMIEDKISLLAAKKRVEKTVRLRSIISLKASDNRSDQAETTLAQTGRGQGSLFDDYYSKITREIWQEWVFPDTGQKGLETIISIKILKDGTTLVQKVEKSSGNKLFDKSALKALTKASPLSPPPYEMEIGVRFYP